MDSSLNTSCYTVGVTSAGAAAITADDVMRWAYLGLAIISLLIPMVVKVIDLIKSKRQLTKDDVTELQQDLEKAKEELEKLQNKDKDK